MEMQKEAFENCFKNTEIYKRELSIRGKDILEFSSSFGYHNIVVNEAFLMWQHAQNIAIPTGFVLFQKEMLQKIEHELKELIEEQPLLALGELLVIQEHINTVLN